MNIKKEIIRAKKYDLISFDIFDTLIERKVSHPTDIFTLTGLKVFKDKSTAEIFRLKRIKAEQSARTKSYNGEVNIDDIYNCLETYDNDVCVHLKEVELSTEIELCKPRTITINLLNELYKDNKKVVFISDMYLPYKTISEMLHKCNITINNNLYISHEYGCNKVSGNLFIKTQKELNLSKCKQLHYGDSIKADILGALKANVTPHWIPKRNLIKVLLRKIKVKLKINKK